MKSHDNKFLHRIWITMQKSFVKRGHMDSTRLQLEYIPTYDQTERKTSFTIGAQLRHSTSSPSLYLFQPYPYHYTLPSGC